MADSGSVRRLVDHYYGASSEEARREELRLAPLASLHRTRRDENLDLDDAAVELVAAVLEESVRITTSLIVAHRATTLDRIERSLRHISRTHRLTLAMNIVMFVSGIVLLVLAVIAALQGKPVAAGAIGGVGLVDLVLFLLREPVRSIREGVASAVELRSVVRSYFEQLDELGLQYDYLARREDLQLKRRVADLIFSGTRQAVTLIERSVKSRPVDDQAVGDGA
jgi:hypothetical protein